MKRKAYQVACTASLVVAFISTIFFSTANLSLAAASEVKSADGTRTSAVEHTEAQIKELHAALAITDTQKPLWDDLVVVMRKNATDMDAINKDKDENKLAMNAVERMKFHSTRTEAHLAQVKQLLPPFETFYTSLSDEQKKTTDTLFQNGRPGGKNKKK